MRGFFHDYMSHAVEGSILSEHHMRINFGLCRWAQYINVLSDETGCDPGSVIALAGYLGYEACGVPTERHPKFEFELRSTLLVVACKLVFK